MAGGCEAVRRGGCSRPWAGGARLWGTRARRRAGGSRHPGDGAIFWPGGAADRPRGAGTGPARSPNGPDRSPNGPESLPVRPLKSPPSAADKGAMGRNMPYNRTDALEWTLSHIGRWEAVAGEIGLDEARVQSMRQAAQAAYDAMIEAEAARAKAKALTETWHRLADSMKADVSAAIATIKATAAAEGRTPGGGGQPAEKAVYAKALLSFGDKPGPAPAPREPSLPTTNLDNTGAVVLSWRGKGRAGTRYAVRRTLPGEATWTVVGDTHEKTFTDRTVPMGTPEIVYQIVARYGPHAVSGPATVMRIGSIGAEAARSVA